MFITFRRLNLPNPVVAARARARILPPPGKSKPEPDPPRAHLPRRSDCVRLAGSVDCRRLGRLAEAIRGTEISSTIQILAIKDSDRLA